MFQTVHEIINTNKSFDETFNMTDLKPAFRGGAHWKFIIYCGEVVQTFIIGEKAEKETLKISR